MRRVLGVGLLVALVLVVLALPLLVVAALVASNWLPGRWRGPRLFAFALVGLTLEAASVVVAFGLWVASGFGYAIRRPVFQRAHLAVLRWLLVVLVGVAQWLFRLEVVTDGDGWSPLDDGVPGSTNAMLVLGRHAGPGDSVLLMETLMNRDHLRRPRVVMKDTMQLDPLVDVYFNRLRAAFVNPSGADGDAAEVRIAELAADLGTEDALLIFPEGGNFTPGRRGRAIRSLRRRGHTESAERAEELVHVLPPRPGGVLAALDAAPHADVVFVAHTGLDHLTGVRDIWRSIPQEKELYLRWWFYAADDVPTGRDQRIEWLFDRWSDIDRWITEHRDPVPH